MMMMMVFRVDQSTLSCVLHVSHQEMKLYYLHESFTLQQRRINDRPRFCFSFFSSFITPSSTVDSRTLAPGRCCSGHAAAHPLTRLLRWEMTLYLFPIMQLAGQVTLMDLSSPTRDGVFSPVQSEPETQTCSSVRWAYGRAAALTSLCLFMCVRVCVGGGSVCVCVFLFF